jgi:hypothetical protein
LEQSARQPVTFPDGLHVQITSLDRLPAADSSETSADPSLILIRVVATLRATAGPIPLQPDAINLDLYTGLNRAAATDVAPVIDTSPFLDRTPIIRSKLPQRVTPGNPVTIWLAFGVHQADLADLTVGYYEPNGATVMFTGAQELLRPAPELSTPSPATS